MRARMQKNRRIRVTSVALRRQRDAIWHRVAQKWSRVAQDSKFFGFAASVAARISACELAWNGIDGSVGHNTNGHNTELFTTKEERRPNGENPHPCTSRRSTGPGIDQSLTPSWLALGSVDVRDPLDQSDDGQKDGSHSSESIPSADENCERSKNDAQNARDNRTVVEAPNGEPNTKGDKIGEKDSDKPPSRSRPLGNPMVELASAQNENGSYRNQNG